MSLQYETISNIIRNIEKYDYQSINTFKNQIKNMGMLLNDTDEIARVGKPIIDRYSGANYGTMNVEMFELVKPTAYLLYDNLFDSIQEQSIKINRNTSGLFIEINYRYKDKRSVSLIFEKDRTLNVRLRMEDYQRDNHDIPSNIYIEPTVLYQLLLIQRLDEEISKDIISFIYTYKSGTHKYIKFTDFELISDVIPGAKIKDLGKFIMPSNSWNDVRGLSSRIIGSLGTIYNESYTKYKPVFTIFVDICKSKCSYQGYDKELQRIYPNDQYIRTSLVFNERDFKTDEDLYLDIYLDAYFDM